MATLGFVSNARNEHKETYGVLETYFCYDSAGKGQTFLITTCRKLRLNIVSILVAPTELAQKKT